MKEGIWFLPEGSGFEFPLVCWKAGLLPEFRIGHFKKEAVRSTVLMRPVLALNLENRSVVRRQKSCLCLR